MKIRIILFSMFAIFGAAWFLTIIPALWFLAPVSVGLAWFAAKGASLKSFSDNKSKNFPQDAIAVSLLVLTMGLVFLVAYPMANPFSVGQSGFIFLLLAMLLFVFISFDFNAEKAQSFAYIAFFALIFGSVFFNATTWIMTPREVAVRKMIENGANEAYANKIYETIRPDSGLFVTALITNPMLPPDFKKKERGFITENKIKNLEMAKELL